MKKKRIKKRIKERKGKDLFSLSQKKKGKERICFLITKERKRFVFLSQKKGKDLFSLSQKKKE